MNDVNEIIGLCVVVVTLIFITGVVEIQNAKEKSNCVVNTSKQNLTADEISKLCGVGK